MVGGTNSPPHQIAEAIKICRNFGPPAMVGS